MNVSNIETLRKALVGKTVVALEFHDSHGMVMDILTNDNQKISICTYEYGKKRYHDEFFVGLNDVEL
jgi:hypothetical protein